MVQTTPQLTDAGRSLLLRAIAGESVEFTRFKLGNGSAPDNEGALTDLVNPILAYPFDEATTGEGYIELTGSFDSTAVESEFKCRELGIFARGEDNTELLYAYANDAEQAGWIRPGGTDAVSEYKTSVVVAIGSAEHVTAIISTSQIYAAKDDLDSHVANTSNPHGVTKAQLDLDNVPNVQTNDQTPTYTVPDETANLTSGEKLSVAFGKIAAAVRDIISHLKNKNNPHEVTVAQIGAAEALHEHSAIEVTAGTLGIARGGTGVNTLDKLRGLMMQTGSYTGNGTFGEGYPCTLIFGFTPKLLIVMPTEANNVTFAQGGQGFTALVGVSRIDLAAQAQRRINFSWSPKTVRWYAADAGAQQNIDGKQYSYIVFF